MRNSATDASETDGADDTLVGLDFLRRSHSCRESPFGYESYFILLKTLSMVGAYSAGHPRQSLKAPAFAAIAVIDILFFYRIVSLFISFGNSNFWTIFVDFLRSLCAFVAVNQFLSLQNKFHNCLYQSLPVLTTIKEKARHRTLEIAVNTLALIGWLYISCRIAFDIFILHSHPKYLLGYAELNFHSAILEPTATNYVVIYLFVIAERTFISGATLFSIITYVLFAITSANQIRLYNNFFKLCHQRKARLCARDIRHWTQNRVKLHIIVGDIESLMSFTAFIWYSAYIFGFCSKILAALESDPSRPDWAKMVVTTTDLIYMNLLMIIVSISGSYVSETSLASASAVHSYVSAREASTSCRFKHESHLLILSQTDPHLKLTASHFFDINKSVVISVWMSVATYALIIISWKEVI